MSLIPIIQPPIMKALTTKKERMIRMEYAPKPVSQKAILLFPILLTLVVGLLVPEATPLISMLMLGNLLKVCGVVDRLSKSAQNEIINVATLFLGLAIGATMEAGGFLSTVTLKIMGLGLIAFMLDTVAGLLVWKADGSHEWVQNQSLDRCVRHFCIPDGRAYRCQDGQ